MKIKNEEIMNLYETLVRISEDKDMIFSIKIGYQLAKIKIKLKDEVNIIYNLREKILREAGNENQDGDFIIPKEKILETNNKIIELMNIENELDLPSIELQDINLNLSIKDIEGLLPIIKIKSE